MKTLGQMRLPSAIKINKRFSVNMARYDAEHLEESSEFLWDIVNKFPEEPKRCFAELIENGVRFASGDWAVCPLAILTYAKRNGPCDILNTKKVVKAIMTQGGVKIQDPDWRPEYDAKEDKWLIENSMMALMQGDGKGRKKAVETVTGLNNSQISDFVGAWDDLAAEIRNMMAAADKKLLNQGKESIAPLYTHTVLYLAATDQPLDVRLVH